MVKYYKPIDELFSMCQELPCGCEFEMNTIHDGFQIICTKDGERQWDAVCHKWSYGGEEELLETMGTIVDNPCDSVEGWLKPIQVFAKFIKKYYEP